MTSVPRGAASAFALALAATALLAAPVLRAPGERIFGSGEILGLEDPNRDPLVVIGQFRTGQVPTPYLQPLTDLPGRALARVMSPVAAYNAIVLSTFPLAAAAAYVLARHVLGSHAGAMVAALAYAFLPFHVTQAGGHPHVAQTHWIPLYFLALWRCVDRPDPARAAQLLAAAAGVVLSNFYGGLIAAALTPVALAAYGIAGAPPHDARRLRRVAVTAAVLLAAAVAALVLVRHFAPGARSLAFDRADLFVWSAKWWSYLVPPVEHPWWGGSVRAFWARQGIAAPALEHQQVSLAWGLVALAFVPLWRWLRGDRSAPAVRLAPVLAIVAAFALLCSLSPERQVGSLVFVRPSALLHAIAPMFRAYSRFGVVVGLMTALLAGAGVACLWSAGAGRVVAMVLLALAAVETLPSSRWRQVHPTPTGPSVAEATDVSRPHVRDLIGFHPREHDAGRTWRWMGQTGALRIVTAPGDAGTTVELELRSFPGPRRVEWLVDARRAGALEVTSDWRRYVLPLGTLEPGEHTLTLACGEPAMAAGTVLDNGDPRLLALALGAWTIRSGGPPRP